MTAETDTSTEIELTPEITGLVRNVMRQVAAGKLTLAEAIAGVFADQVVNEEVTPTAAHVAPITEAQLAAISRLAEVYGQVAPASPRLLTKDEQIALVEERQVVDTVLGLLKKRKEEGIRETIANHLDRLVEKQITAGGSPAPKDRNGHYAVKQDVPVDGTDQKLQRIVSQPKPEISGAVIQDLHEQGKISHADYLAITRMPEVKRSFDKDKASKAIEKDSGLMFRLATAVTQAAPGTTIKVQKA